MIRKKLFLHIGDAKTGSSTIQDTCTKIREQMLAEGVLYPSVGLLVKNGIAQHKLAFSVNCDRPEFWKERDILFSDLVEEVYKSKCDKAIVSSEGFCSLRTEEELSVLKGMLSEFNVKIVAYVRRPDLWIESWYAQVVKNVPFSRKTFSQYLDNHQEPSLTTILKYGQVFGFDNLIVRPFERDKFFQQDLLSDFFSCFGIRISVVNSKFANVTPDIYIVELLRILNDNLVLDNKSRISLYKKIMSSFSFSVVKNYFDPERRIDFIGKYKKNIDEFSLAFSGGKEFFESFNPKVSNILSCYSPNIDDVVFPSRQFLDFIINN